MKIIYSLETIAALGLLYGRKWKLENENYLFFGNYCSLRSLIWEKMKIIYFLETIAALGLKVAWIIQLNELMKLSEYQRSKSFFDLGQRSLRL